MAPRYIADHAKVEQVSDAAFGRYVTKLEGGYLSGIEMTIGSDHFRSLVAIVRSQGTLPDYMLNELRFDLRPLAVAYRDAAVDSGRLFARMAKPVTSISKVEFDPSTNDFIQDLLRRAQLVSGELDAKTRNAVRAAMRKGLQSDLAPDELAMLLQNSIGLDDRYAAAVENNRQMLVNSGKTKAEARKLSGEYAKRLRKSRAETIARTETAKAVQMGQRHAYEQTMTTMGIPDSHAVYEWITSKDEKTCPNCAPMSGEQAPKSDPVWTTPIGSSDGPPLHPNCRCTTTLRFT